MRRRRRPSRRARNARSAGRVSSSSAPGGTGRSSRVRDIQTANIAPMSARTERRERARRFSTSRAPSAANRWSSVAAATDCSSHVPTTRPAPARRALRRSASKRSTRLCNEGYNPALERAEMRKAVALLIVTLGLVACGSTSLTASHPSPSPVVHPTSSQAPTATTLQLVDPVSVPKLTGTYGLLVSRAPIGSPYFLKLVKSDATLAATVAVSWSDGSITCTGGTDSVIIPRPVSASNGHVYVREGSAIRMVVPPSTLVDVTTVPDGSRVVSMFSVSPDDQKIAVVVLDTSSPTAITTRLYVEVFFSGAPPADIYTVSASRSGTPTTLWPMGWHQGNLVLAVVPACAYGVQEWHVSSPVTAGRVATIKGNNCQMSVPPSPAGVACAQASGPTTLYNWGGKVLGVTGPGVQFSIASTGLSPAGESHHFSVRSNTPIVQLGPGPYAA